MAPWPSDLQCPLSCLWLESREERSGGGLVQAGHQPGLQISGCVEHRSVPNPVWLNSLQKTADWFPSGDVPRSLLTEQIVRLHGGWGPFITTGTKHIPVGVRKNTMQSHFACPPHFSCVTFHFVLIHQHEYTNISSVLHWTHPEKWKRCLTSRWQKAPESHLTTQKHRGGCWHFQESVFSSCLILTEKACLSWSAGTWWI